MDLARFSHEWYELSFLHGSGRRSSVDAPLAEERKARKGVWTNCRHVVTTGAKTLLRVLLKIRPTSGFVNMQGDPRRKMTMTYEELVGDFSLEISAIFEVLSCAFRQVKR